MTQRTTLVPIVLAALLLAACQVPSPHASSVLPATKDEAPAAGKATLTFSIAWPDRTTQTIPLSAEAIRIRVLKGETVLAERVQTRVAQSPTAQGSLWIDADSGLTIRAEAFDVRTITAQDVPCAVAEQQNVTLLPNQRASFNLPLIPTVVPVITDYQPKNGGPGVTVTLSGRFGWKGPFAVILEGLSLPTNQLSDTTLAATVPANALSGTWTARANGVNSVATGSFKVLTALDVKPAAATSSVGLPIAFSVPTGLDTEAATVSNPTITQWQAVIPGTSTDTPLGTISASGDFQPTAPGTIEIRAYSGTLVATATLTVQ